MQVSLDRFGLLLAVLYNWGGENHLDMVAKIFSKVTEGLCDVIF